MDIFRQTRVFYRDRLSFWLTNFSIIFVLANIVFFFFYKVKPSPIAVLHYNIYDGFDILGDHRWIYYIVAITFVFSVVDFILAVLLWTRERVWSYFLLTTILLSNTLIFLYLYNIINYNL